MFEFLKSLVIIAYWMGLKPNKPAKMYKTLFPEDKQIGDKLEFVPGIGGKQVQLAPSTYDAPAYLLQIDPAVTKDSKLALFRTKKRVTERQKQDYQNAVARNMPSQINSLKKKIMDEMSDLIEGGEVVADVMAGQLLSTGTVTIAANGANLSAVYGVLAAQKETLLSTAKWSDTTNSTPIADIERWRDAVADLPESGGEKPSRAICRTKTFNYIKNNAGIRAAMAASASFKDITTQMVIDFVKAKTDVEIFVYDASHKDHTGLVTQYVFPEEIFTLLPAGEVGRMVFGTTPEENEMGKAGKDIALAGDAQGIAVKVKEVDDEVEETEVKASVILLPSGEGLGKIFIATVHS